MVRNVIFGEYLIPDISRTLTIAQVQEELGALYPSMKDAVGIENEEGDFVFTPKAAEKGC